MISVYAQNPYLFRHGPIRTAGGDSPEGLGNPPGRPDGNASPEARGAGRPASPCPAACSAAQPPSLMEVPWWQSYCNLTVP